MSMQDLTEEERAAVLRAINDTIEDLMHRLKSIAPDDESQADLPEYLAELEHAELKLTNWVKH